MSGRKPKYIPGNHWTECQVCGFTYRQSEMRERWDGLIVCKPDWEPRHPQDFVRVKPEDTSAKGLVNPPQDTQSPIGYVEACGWDIGYSYDLLCNSTFGVNQNYAAVCYWEYPYSETDLICNDVADEGVT